MHLNKLHNKELKYKLSLYVQYFLVCKYFIILRYQFAKSNNILYIIIYAIFFVFNQFVFLFLLMY